MGQGWARPLVGTSSGPSPRALGLSQPETATKGLVQSWHKPKTLFLLYNYLSHLEHESKNQLDQSKSNPFRWVQPRLSANAWTGIFYTTVLPCIVIFQVYPAVKDQQKPLTRLQERLIKKLGPNAYPFFFEVFPFVFLPGYIHIWQVFSDLGMLWKKWHCCIQHFESFRVFQQYNETGVLQNTCMSNTIRWPMNCTYCWISQEAIELQN